MGDAAWQQLWLFAGWLLLGWWLSVYPHCDDGIPDPPRRRLAERQAWAARYDPGLRVTLLQDWSAS